MPLRRDECASARRQRAQHDVRTGCSSGRHEGWSSASRLHTTVAYRPHVRSTWGSTAGCLGPRYPRALPPRTLALCAPALSQLVEDAARGTVASWPVIVEPVLQLRGGGVLCVWVT